MTDQPRFPALAEPVKRYRTAVYDSSRWDGFQFRPDDIVISTPAKCGTTWMQMICALLVFGTPNIPARLATLSPWLDYLPKPIKEVHADLAAQRHRRFIKTHTPLDGVPQSPGVTFVVVGRDPRDVALSFDHFAANVDLDVVREHLRRRGEVEALESLNEMPGAPHDRRERVLGWLLDDGPPGSGAPGLRDVLQHLTVAWERRNDPDVVLVHYADLSADQRGQMEVIAHRLGIEVAPHAWPDLVEAASFHRMKENAHAVVPDAGIENLFRDKGGFFHSGSSGQWRDVLTEEDLDRYDKRVAGLASPDLVHWLHHGSLG